MARSHPVNSTHDERLESGAEWGALRGELVALLDQVEGRFAQAGQGEAGLEQLSERMRDLRSKVAGTGPDLRHREALRSVKRAIDRFSERDEAGPVNPQDTLQAAIREIRSSQAARRPEMRSAPMPERQAASTDLHDLGTLMNGLSQRLEMLDAEIKAQRANAGGAREVRAIAEQVAQLTHVVELLAGAVGETGQIKRLEGQIASLAAMVGQPQAVDLSTVNQRIEDLGSSVARLADMQAAHFGRPTKEAPAQAKALKDGMHAIEASVRNVYDRIDAIEKSYALSPGDVERLTEEMSAFTAAMRVRDTEPKGLIKRIDALSAQLENVKGGGRAVSDLKIDIASLRDSVLEAFEPRFAAIESRIDALGQRISAQGEGAGMIALQDEVRRLVSSVEDSSRQLESLRLASEEREDGPDFEAMAVRVARDAAPDLDKLASMLAKKSSPSFEALADMVARKATPDFDEFADLVATRATGAMAKQGAPLPAPVLNEEGLAELERRMSSLFRESRPATEAPDLSEFHRGIKEVGEKLDRLESTLRSTSAPAPVQAPLHLASRAAAFARDDSMPLNPADDAPLRDLGFPHADPVRSALRAKSNAAQTDSVAGEPVQTHIPDNASKRLMEAEAQPPAGLRGTDLPPAFDPMSVARPPRPSSAFDADIREPFSPAPQAQPVILEPFRPEAASSAPAASSRSTFQAALKAAQRHNGAKGETSGSNSLLGRALQNLKPAAAAGTAPAVAVAPETQAKAASQPAAKKQRWLGRKAKPAAEVAPALPSDVPAKAVAPMAKPESFLLRHKRSILLAASVVAISLMTLNLVAQRMGAAAPAPAEATGSLSAPVIAPDAEAPVIEPSPAEVSGLTGPRTPQTVPASLDATAVGSIDPQARMEPFVPEDLPPLPESLALTDAAETPAAEPIASPVQVELPPEELGPEGLRTAAASGDARSQFEVAAIYSEGRVLPQDFAAAAAWYERAAAQGFAPAQYRLGSLYESGKGVTKDLEQARLWYQRAAEAGNRMSMHNLAALYAGGEMGTQEFASAAQWFEEAAMRGLTDSQFNLGMLYARGLGVEQSLDASYKWFSLAAANGDADAAKARDDVARSLSADAITRLGTEIAAWTPVAIDLPANFAPIGTWSSEFDPGVLIDNREVVIKVQAALAKLGYDVGTPDGLAGPKTAEAIKAFERATGMSEVGVINPRLLAVLGSQPV